MNHKLATVAALGAAQTLVSTAMAAHLSELLQASGATLAVAVGVGALVGPAQVAGRVLEFGVLRAASIRCSRHASRRSCIRSRRSR